MSKPINKLKVNIGQLHDFDFIPIWDPTVGEAERITVFKLRSHILSGVTSEDTFTTGATFSNGFAYFDTNKQTNAYSLDLSDLIASGGSSTVNGFVYDGSSNMLTIQQTLFPDLTVYLNEFSGLTVNGAISATTYYGDGSNLTGVSGTDNYTTGSTLNGNILVFDRTDALSAYTVDLSGLVVSGGSGDNYYTTGATLNGNILTFNRTDALSAYTVDLSGLVTSGGSGSSSIRFASTPPTASLYSGDTWIRTTDYEVFFYDVIRGKWLTSNTNSFEGARDKNNQTNVFLRTVDGNPYNTAPYIIPKDSTITGMMGETATSDTFKILISTGTTLPSDVITQVSIVTDTFNKDMGVNIDVPEDSHLYLYMSGTTIDHPKTTIYYKYKG